MPKKGLDLSNPVQRKQYWTELANEKLKGKTIKRVRYMTPEEADEALMWNNQCVVIEFTDGTLIFPSSDDEGNEAGVIFGQTPKGEEITLPVLRDAIGTFK